MWVHLVIFIVAAGSAFAWKAGWLKLDGLADRESVRWFLIVAVCGNLVGMLLTLTSGSSEVYTNGYRLEKESTGAYTQLIPRCGRPCAAHMRRIDGPALPLYAGTACRHP